MQPELNEYPSRLWHEVMTLTLSPYKGDMYSVHLLTEETILV